jgi:hypothetical protein|tara:strand:+ start:493 stop:882 length:390 start_codon:yes stop_codon:yes gene_type:complete
LLEQRNVTSIFVGSIPTTDCFLSFKEKVMQLTFDLVGGHAVHPSWDPYLQGLSSTSSRGMAAELYNRYKGAAITKKEIKQLWSSLDLTFMSRVLFTYDHNAIIYHYDLIKRGLPSDNWVNNKTFQTVLH